MNIFQKEQYVRSIDRALDILSIDALKNKTILVTGATGMIGSCLIDILFRLNQRGMNIRVIATSRNSDKLYERFPYFSQKDDFIPVDFHALEPFELDINVDYIIHAASNADPENFIKYPAETLLANVLGAKTLLDFGIKHQMKRFLFISSGEFYGQPDEYFSDFTEDYCGKINHAAFRSCYPVGKRAAEVLCQSYIQEYDTDCVIARPCHIFGPTATEQDSRALSDFFRKVIQGEDIILKSSGKMERSHCYVIDCAVALLFILLHGVCGEAYNIADKRYQMTIFDFAKQLCEKSHTQLKFVQPTDAEKRGYNQVSRAVLDPSKLVSLGWKPSQDEDRIQETLSIMS